jgi:hypothetical protein
MRKKKKNSQGEEDDLTVLSTIGISGERIQVHRSLRRLAFPRSRLAVVILLPLAFNFVTWFASESVGIAWTVFFDFWITNLGLPGSVTLKPPGPGWLDFALPHLELPSLIQDSLTWYTTLIVTVVVFLLTWFIPERFLPLCYFLRFATVIQISALLFFAIIPQLFPYTLTDYIEGSLRTGTWFMLIVPWIHGLTYYILDFSVFQKIWLTLLSLLFIIVALPFQIMLHAYLLAKFSLLFLPLLYLLFGLLLNVFVCIALYGWAMSWQRKSNSMLEHSALDHAGL